MVEADGLDLHERFAASERGQFLAADFNHLRTARAWGSGDETTVCSIRIHEEIM
jgi:hypothetical protein